MPNEKLLSLLKSLLCHFNYIIVVDDGSGEKYKTYFEQIENIGVTVLHHQKNMGKGYALKTAFKHCI